ncbi:P-loop containing nucleoside triphosphate hydrolase protein [Massarina eburnea CBS 473.64]|uniref:Structural maintenance of chromosomes protein 5 n=1 Tax=Massarina eburnea CBS 473.64 TaxID=1395130 RepID=A0A6A6RIR8_9PLEO|nr:P-loop containing nucleoside triphosphate hydrolase protein [Massarina eburnea CBS 473.64]
MPGIKNDRKRAAAALSDSDDQSEVSYGSSASKRVRHARDASGTAAPMNESENSETHQPGSLVRVKLTNFVTYTAAEFHLGPSLNMIIGPNGTGKSTLVCAICLGLGWSPINLGRAKEIGEFVKHGHPEAEIEIELAASANQTPNPIIRRVIRKEGNKSQFYIGRKSVPQKDVTALAKSFSIQIDNLCQFLPQDRVVEFAKLEPIELLRETQRAAAPEYMVEWHNELKALRNDEKKLEVERENQDNFLKGLQSKQDATRHDVERYNERQDLVAESELLEKGRPIILTKILRTEVKQLVDDLNTTVQEYKQYQKEVDPAQRAQREMEVYRDQIDAVTKSRKRRFEAGHAAASGFAPKIDAEKQKMEGCAAEIEAERQADRQRKQDRKRIENTILSLRRSKDENPVEYDAATFDVRLGEIRNKRAGFDRQYTEYEATLKAIRNDVIGKQAELKNIMGSRNALDTQIGQQGKLLTKLSPDTFKAWEWLEQNKASLNLKEDVYAPPILSCSVPDTRFAAIVESHLRPRGELVTITCTNADDTRTVLDKLVGTPERGGLGLHHITIRTSPQPRSAYKPPITTSELHNIGFDSWIIDYIEGPDAVLAMLCDSAKLHRAAYASKPITNRQFDSLAQSGILRCVNGTEVCTIRTRSEYAGASSTSITSLRPAHYFTEQAVDADEKRRLDETIAERRHDIQDQKGRHEEAMSKLTAIKKDRAAVEGEQAEIRNEQEALRKAFVEWEGLPRKIATKEEELKTNESLCAETHNRIRQAQGKADNSALKVASLTLQHAQAVTKLRNLHESYIEAEIRLVEANSEVDGYTSDNRLIERALDERKARISALKAQKNDTKARYKEQLAEANDILKSVSEAEQDELKKYSDLTTEELDLAIGDVNTRLSMLAEGNPNAIKNYEKREKDIRTTQEKLENNVAQLKSTREKITGIRKQWEPQLDELVSKISDGFAHNFQQIGCAGQVGVYKDEDFEKWAIQIQVRFRENESLQILDSHRQSGGERAVSTIFYLMALQDLARSPFRVVDEINQGMDPRNERMVHERMVDIACRERTSQYFLITPKLLNDLKFHPKMKVHCIASGEHMPDQNTNLDFQKLAKIALRVRKGVSAAA